MNYCETLSDDEIIYMIKQNNKEAERLLFSRYEKKIRGILDINKKLYLNNLDSSAIQTIYLDSLWEAIKTYDNKRGTFYSFVVGLLYYETVRSYRRNVFNNDKEIITDFNDVNMQLKDSSQISEEIKIDYKIFIDKLKIYDLELYQVVNYWLNSYSYEEISSMMNINTKQVYYLLKKGIDWLKKQAKSK